MTLRIGGREVGREHPPLVIAEMSGNHNGSCDAALKLVRAAADAGAHAIKLQTFTAATLTIDSRRPEFFIDDPASLWHTRRLWELYEEAHTPWEWHEPIFAEARKRGLLCISSAFDLSSVEFLVKLGVDAIKLASFELVHIPLIEAAAKSGRPVILSTGMAAQAEIDDAVAALRLHGCETFVLLKCTSAYPAEEKDADVRTMIDLRDKYGCEVGLSDHTLRPYVAFAATALGASVIEKHFALKRSDGGLDAAFSLEPAEMKELVAGAELVWRSLGSVRYGPKTVERTSLKERCSIYVVKQVKRGEPFTPENIRVIRPGNGLPPKHYRTLLGKRSARDLDEATPLSWDLVA